MKDFSKYHFIEEPSDAKEKKAFRKLVKEKERMLDQLQDREYACRHALAVEIAFTASKEEFREMDLRKPGQSALSSLHFLFAATQMHLSIGSAQMDKQSSQELLSESNVAGFSRVQKPKLATVELQLLPYDVLRDILSRLSIKDVVRMSTLSLEWKLLRICHPELVFTKHTFGISTDTNTNPDLVSKDFFSIIKDMDTKRASWAAEFITNVDSVLHPLWSTCTTTTTTLDKFAVEFGLRRMHKYHIDRWVSFSIASRAKHIAFDFTFDVNFFGPGCDQYKYVFPMCRLSGPNGSCVTSLVLGYVAVPACSHCELDMIDLHAPNLTKFEFDDHPMQTVLTQSSKLSEAIFVSNLRVLDGYDDVLDYIFTELPTALPHVHTLLLLLTVNQMDHDRFCSENPRTVLATQGPPHRHLKSVYMSGFCDVLGLAELALYILRNATVLQRMVVDPVAGMMDNALIERFCSVSNGGSSEDIVFPTDGTRKYVSKKRMFAKNNLDKEEFCRVLTIL
ncbi:uncharacterized protein LOC125530930 [Triticum urartu]|uniref:uncharacterized protein LOC125530930 n=1 Tax=Triticum urartu TaxID=4572 RepID=UPI0020446D1F|nr:uncharacterized protein LOC125530930 [Triticum urartu]